MRLSGRDPASGQGIELQIRNGLLHAVGTCAQPAPQWLSAGLVDLQVNGFAGYDLNDGHLTAQRLLSLANELLACGVTTFLPTLITASRQQIERSLQVIQQAREQHLLLWRMIPAVHLEGPYISPQDGPRGAHPRAHVRAPDRDEFTRWQQCCDSLIGMLTLSPHWPQSAEFIAWLRAQGLVIGMGHTDASQRQLLSAVDAGASVSTHLGNGAAAMLARHPNLLWTQLAEDRLQATFIADGHHLPDATLKSMLRAKGLQRSILVSDVVAAGGLNPGTYQQAVGGRVVLAEDGRLSLEGTPYLAGAALPLHGCVAMAVRAAGITLAQALAMASCNAAALIGRSAILAVGEPADLITFDWQEGDTSLRIDSVFKHGEKVV